MMIPLQGLIKRRCICMCVDVCRLCVVTSNERVSEHVKQYRIKSQNVLMRLSRVDMVGNNAYNFPLLLRLLLSCFLVVFTGKS